MRYNMSGSSTPARITLPSLLHHAYVLIVQTLADGWPNSAVQVHQWRSQ
jgi:hypothetical protein